MKVSFSQNLQSNGSTLPQRLKPVSYDPQNTTRLNWLRKYAFWKAGCVRARLESCYRLMIRNDGLQLLRKAYRAFRLPFGVFPRPLKSRTSAAATFATGTGVAAIILAGLTLFSTALPCAAQKLTLTPPVEQQSSQSSQPSGQVIYSRSTDEDGQTTTRAAQSASAPAIRMASEPSAEDADRQAVTFTEFDMDVRLNTMAQHIAVRALVTVRNDGKAALPRIPLQISSSLNWERIRANGRNVSFPVATLNSDTDHTGQLHEAVVPLAIPLAPGQTIQLDVTYSGSIAPSAQRLLAIGTPEDVALHSDWDGIGAAFTGLRGFGNVVWYPVSAPPVILGDGARLFDEIGEHKLRMAGASFRLRLTTEFPHGHAPTVALINGHPAQLSVTESGSLDQNQEVSGVATAELGRGDFGIRGSELVCGHSHAPRGNQHHHLGSPGERGECARLAAATAAVTPFLQGWLGQRPRAQLTLLDLPDVQDAPFETGAMLATTIRQTGPGFGPEQLNGIMAHALTHSWMLSPRAWLSEGVAHFMGTLWVERQSGREQALGTLEAARPALALAEPPSPGLSAGQPLAAAISPVYYRTKATYVLWMLRDVVGDATLSAALRAYDPAADVSKGYGRDTGRSSFERLLEQAGTRNDLSRFFGDWVDANKGLPDLNIESAYPSSPAPGSWLVAVNLANAGYVSVEVPVTVRSDSTTATQRVLVPARGKAVQRILIQGKPTEVQVNDGAIPETQASVHVTKLGD